MPYFIPKYELFNPNLELSLIIESLASPDMDRLSTVPGVGDG